MEVDKFGIGIPGRNMTSGDWLLTNIIPASQLEQICLEFCRAMLILAFFFFLGKKKNSLKSHGFLHNEGGRKFEFFFFFFCKIQDPEPMVRKWFPKGAWHANGVLVRIRQRRMQGRGSEGGSAGRDKIRTGWESVWDFTHILRATGSPLHH